MVGGGQKRGSGPDQGTWVDAAKSLARRVVYKTGSISRTGQGEANRTRRQGRSQGRSGRPCGYSVCYMEGKQHVISRSGTSGSSQLIGSSCRLSRKEEVGGGGRWLDASLAAATGRAVCAVGTLLIVPRREGEGPRVRGGGVGSWRPAVWGRGGVGAESWGWGRGVVGRGGGGRDRLHNAQCPTSLYRPTGVCCR